MKAIVLRDKDGNLLDMNLHEIESFSRVEIRGGQEHTLVFAEGGKSWIIDKKYTEFKNLISN